MKASMAQTRTEGYILTQKGFEKLKEKRELLASQMSSLTINMGKAVQEEKKISENAQYSCLLIEYNRLLTEIRDVDKRITNCTIVENSNTEAVDIGSVVRILIDDEEEKYEIVGQLEGDPFNNKISYDSPLGKELMNRIKGDSFSFREMEIEIIDIE